jgi:hypothetical protein
MARVGLALFWPTSPWRSPPFELKATQNRRRVEASPVRLAPVVNLIGGLCPFP